jgi:hypothetical protein
MRASAAGEMTLVCCYTGSVRDWADGIQVALTGTVGVLSRQ